MREELLEYKGLSLNANGSSMSGSRCYVVEHLELLHSILTDDKYLGFSVCHICVTIDPDESTNYYTRLFKVVFAGCVYILKRENAGGSFNDNELDVADSKGEHFHLFVLFPSDLGVSVASFSKRFKDLIGRVNRNKYRPRKIRNFNIVSSAVKGWVWPEYLEKYDVWFDSLEERREFKGVKRSITLKPSNMERVFRWASYLAKAETPTGKTQKAFFVRDLTES